MKRNGLIVTVSALLLGFLSQDVPTRAAEPETTTRLWLDNFEGAVSLTFDDGMPSQLERAVPILNRHKLKATFYVNPGHSVDWAKHAPIWRQLALDGHELSNHTDRHPCTCQSDFRHGEEYCTEKLGLGEIARAVDDAELALRELTSLPAAKRSFADPCYNSDVGAGLTRTSYTPEIAKRYSAARIGFGKDNDPETVDLFYVHGLAADQRNADGIIAHIDNALRKGRWAVIVFHGIGAEWDTVSVADFERVIAYLDNNRQRIWVAPFIDVADRIRSHRATKMAQQVSQ